MASGLVLSCICVCGLAASIALGQQVCPTGSAFLQRPLNDANEKLGSDVSAAGTLIAASAPGLYEPGFLRGEVVLFRRSAAGVWEHETTLRIPVAGVGTFAQFGAAVHTDGTRVVVANPRELNAMGSWAGAVYVFRREPAGNWVQEQRLMNPGPDTSGRFGLAIAIEGDRLLVGPTTTSDPGNPAAVVYYTRDLATNVWSVRQILTPTGAPAAQTTSFGSSVAIAQGRVCVGSPFDFDEPTSASHGAVYIFDPSPQGTFSQTARVLGPTPSNPNVFFGDYFGSAVACTGSTFITSAPQLVSPGNLIGAAYIYEQTGGTSGPWSLAAKLLPDGPQLQTGFGSDVALLPGFAAVGEPNLQIFFNGVSSGVVHLYERTGATSWTSRGMRSTRPVGYLLPDAHRSLGASVAFSVDQSGTPSFVLGAPETIGGREDAGSVDVLPVVASITDCNRNGLDDPCEITGGYAPDLNVNGIPDVCCPIDIDGNQVVNTLDIIAFLNAFFARAPIANYNRTGGITAADIFDFLNAWFQRGC